MARPIKQGMEYFPHDVDAMSDDKIEVLRALHGNDGYVFYFGLLERIYRQTDFEYDISDEETIQILCKKFLISKESFEKILHTALKYACFDTEIYKNTGCLTSNGIKKRAEAVIKKRESMRNKRSWRVSDAETLEETVPQKPQSKVKDSKVKDSKVKDSKVKDSKVKDSKVKESKVNLETKISARGFMPPSLEEVTDYCIERKGGVNPQRFIDFYSAKGWMVGKTKMKDWKAAVRTWEKQEDDDKKSFVYDERNVEGSL